MKTLVSAFLISVYSISFAQIADANLSGALMNFKINAVGALNEKINDKQVRKNYNKLLAKQNTFIMMISAECIKRNNVAVFKMLDKLIRDEGIDEISSKHAKGKFKNFIHAFIEVRDAAKVFATKREQKSLGLDASISDLILAVPEYIAKAADARSKKVSALNKNLQLALLQSPLEIETAIKKLSCICKK